MKKGYSLVSTVIISVLLVGLGMMVQYRFAVIGDQVFPDILWLQALKSDKVSTKTSPMVSPDKVDLSQFWEVWALLQQDYVDPAQLDQATMVDGATRGLAGSLDDPYTLYLPPADNKRSAEDLAGTFSGVGIELGYKEKILAVVAPLSDSPAAKAGVQAGDLILRVKDSAKNLDEATDGWSLEKAIEQIRGPKGSTVTLTLYRENNGNQPFEVDVVRDDVIVKSAEVEFVPVNGKDVAHIKLARFGGHTDTEWDSIVQQIQQRTPPVSGIVLDMRNNPGGFFDGAISVASEFIPGGKVVSQQGKFSTQDYMTKGEPRLKGIPLVALVNKGSASAAEIVAGALRDRLQTKLVGEQTFGKGTVQDQRELTNGGGLHVTIARWLLPGGSNIHDEGLPVDVEAKDDYETKEKDEALDQAIKTLLSDVKN